MKRNKLCLTFWVGLLIFSILFFTIWCYFCLAIDDENKIIDVFLILMFVIPWGIYKIVSYSIKIKNDRSENTILEYDKDLFKVYNSVKDDEYTEPNSVYFVKDGVRFSAKGKYGFVKNFIGIKGYHFGFAIEGTKLAERPEDYEDTLDYEDLLFNIDLAYFEGELLSEPENDNGIIVEDISNLKGKTIKIQLDDGYIADICTTDIDEIDEGEIKFVEWNENSKVIRFKLLVQYGLYDVIVGNVNLTEDNKRAE